MKAIARIVAGNGIPGPNYSRCRICDGWMARDYEVEDWPSVYLVRECKQWGCEAVETLS